MSGRGNYKYQALQNLKILMGFIIGTLFILLFLLSFMRERTIPFNPGSQIPDLSGYSPDNQKHSLSDLSSKYVLVHFWASWSEISNEQMSAISKLHNEYSDSDLEVFSISMDYSKNEWVNGISDNQMKWSNHVSDLQGWNSELANQMNVKIIPSNFLVDPDRNIIGKNLSPQKIEMELHSRLQ